MPLLSWPAAVREYGTFDIAAGAAAAAAACRVVVSRVGSIGVMGRKESMPPPTAGCGDDAEDDSERLLPCVELLQGLTFAASGGVDSRNNDDVMFDQGLQGLACVDEGNCLDLEDLDAACMRAISCDSEGTGASSSPEPDAAAAVGSSGGDVLLRAGGSDGSSDMDCMSVASEGTCVGCGVGVGCGAGPGEAEVDSAASVDGDQHMMTG